jgi:hypothetical protein
VSRRRAMFFRWNFGVFFQRQFADVMALAGKEED